MPEYKRDTSESEWIRRRSWDAVRAELEALEARGEECAGFKVRTGRAEADEGRAGQHARTRDLFAGATGNPDPAPERDRTPPPVGPPPPAPPSVAQQQPPVAPPPPPAGAAPATTSAPAPDPAAPTNGATETRDGESVRVAAWAKLDDGSWGAWVRGAPPEPGERIVRRARSGREQDAWVERVIWTGPDKFNEGQQVSLCTVTTEAP